MTQEATGAAAREYKPLLDDMQAAMSAELGDLFWLPRQDTSVTERSRDDATKVVRVGPDFARGVPLATVDPKRLTEAVNQVLRRHDFPEQDTLSGSYSGHLTFTCRDGGMAELSFWVKGDLEYWVDVPLGPQPR